LMGGVVVVELFVVMVMVIIVVVAYPQSVRLSLFCVR
jgi:hypothetical protein